MRRRAAGWGAASGALAVLWTASAQAGEPSEAARKARAFELTHSAQELMAEGSHVQAVERLAEAYALFPSGATLYLQGVALEALERLEEAVAAHDLFLARFPEHSHVRKVRDRLEALLVTLVVTTTAHAAEVFLDGRSVGRGQRLELRVRHGEHLVRVELPSHRAWTQTVRTRPRELVHLFAELVPDDATLIVEGTELGLAFRMDGGHFGRLGEVVTVPPGRHLLHFEAPGFKPRELIVNLEPGVRRTLRANLEPLVVVVENPVWPWVTLAGGGAAWIAAAVLTGLADEAYRTAGEGADRDGDGTSELSQVQHAAQFGTDTDLAKSLLGGAVACWAAGAALAGASLLGLVLDGGGEEGGAAESEVMVAPRIGPLSVGLEGRF